MALRMIKAVNERYRGIGIFGFDPVVSDSDIKDLGIEPTKTYEDAFEKSDLVLLMNNHPLIASINFNTVANKMKTGGMIYDYWGRLDKVRELPNQVIPASWGSHGFVPKGKINE